jgi:zinc transport system substrate-binding protein
MVRIAGRTRGWRRGVGVVAGLALASLLSSCASSDSAEAPDRIAVVAGFYALAEAAERVGGDLVVIDDLTPPGVEPHDLELTPDDVEAVVTADVVVLAGAGFQPALEDAAAQAQGVVVDVLDAVSTLPPPAGEQEGGDAHGEELAADPHVWLDPIRFSAAASVIAEALAQVSPGDRAVFQQRAAEFDAELRELDAELEQGLAICERRTIVVNHAAFGYLAEAYGLEQLAISGVSPEAEPDPARMAELAELVVREGVTTVFTEELVSPEVAEALSREAGVVTQVLSPVEGLTHEQREAGEDYGSIMRENLAKLRAALGCE